MGARVADARVGRGEQVVIDFACQNESLKNIEKAEVTVNQEIHWTSGSRSNDQNCVIAHNIFKQTTRWQKIDKAKIVKSKAPTDTRILQLIHAAIHDGENRALLSIPTSAIETYQGFLIKVHHRLKIKVYTGGSCTDNPTIKLPICIGTPSSYNQTQSDAQIESPTIALPATTAPPTSMSGQNTPSTSPQCFGANDGGKNGILGKAVRSYVYQDCANNKECDIAQTYGWPMNSWCVGIVRNTSGVTSMFLMFRGARSFNGDLLWNTSRVTDMSFMFEGASSFNGDISNFDTSSVTKMNGMFYNALAFDGDLSNFDTSSVTNLNGMFFGASSFNQDLCEWRDSFPYTADTGNIFFNSGCTYRSTPQAAQKGPFCASDCQS